MESKFKDDHVLQNANRTTWRVRRLRRHTYLQSVQGVEPAEQPPRGEEPVQVHVLGVGALAVQAVAEVMELRLGQSRSRAQDHLLPGRRQVGIQAHVDPHATQAEQDGHLDEALGEVLLQVQHGLGARQQTRGASGTDLSCKSEGCLLPLSGVQRR